MVGTPAWKMYERLVASFEVEGADMDASVTPNASLVGSISGVSRQIDVLVDARFENGGDRRIIFDAKLRKRKVDVKEVESFEGMMRDVRASRGVLVCTNGYTEAARRRAETFIDVRIMEEEEALEHDFALTDACPNCARLGERQRGIVFWDGQFPLPVAGAWAIVFTGKCDQCRSFAFWCWGCGEKTAVPDGTVHECGCGCRWFTEAAEDEVSFIVALEDGEMPLDRRPLR
jgi:hypothetical protein